MMQPSASGDWGFFLDEVVDEEGYESSENESRHGSETTSAPSESASTAGLAELNTWLWDSCELGVAAWMRAGEPKRDGRRRCYLMTGGDCGPTRARRQVYGRRRRRNAPQQLWCVTPFEAGRVRANPWECIVTAMTPRLCPRVFSREFAGGVIVGASLGSIRVVSNVVTGARCCEYLLMVSCGDRCRRSWRRQAHFSRHANDHWNDWSHACRGAWALAEAERRWFSSVDDYPYVAGRHVALEQVVREILFSATSTAELLSLAGAEEDDLGPPPSLAEVKMRPAPNGADANELPANDQDYAALFGGELSSDYRSLRALGDIASSCRRDDAFCACEQRRKSRKHSRTDAAPPSPTISETPELLVGSSVFQCRHPPCDDSAPQDDVDKHRPSHEDLPPEHHAPRDDEPACLLAGLLKALVSSLEDTTACAGQVGVDDEEVPRRRHRHRKPPATREPPLMAALRHPTNAAPFPPRKDDQGRLFGRLEPHPLFAPLARTGLVVD